MASFNIGHQWRDVTLNDVCMKITDGAHLSPKSVEYGLPMASVKDLTSFGITVDSCRHIAKEDFDKLIRQGCQPLEGDVLIAKDGASALDTVCVVRKTMAVVLLSSVAILRPDKSKILPSFLRYYLDSETTRSYMKSAFTTGAAIPRVVLKDFKLARIKLPPLPTQRKIAAILSAYDDLIENNLRRIKILEEIAQNLYREWFVKFRFPGHQHARFTDSPLGRIPEGWEVVPMEEVCSRITDGSHRSPKTTEAGYPMASVKDMHDWGITLETCRKISEEEFRDLRRNDCIMRQGDVLIAKDGSYLKHCFVVEKDADVALLSSIAILRPSARIRSHILARTLLEPHIKERMKGYVSGAALPRIVLKEFRRFQLVLPPVIIQEQWALLAGPMIKLCWRLNDKNQNLRRTRDLLLPRVISGEVDVSELDIAVPEEASA
jgi:type I restriction enzyme S subunit